MHQVSVIEIRYNSFATAATLILVTRFSDLWWALVLLPLRDIAATGCRIVLL